MRQIELRVELRDIVFEKKNKPALSLYESFGFQNTGVEFSDGNYVLVRFPDNV